MPKKEYTDEEKRRLYQMTFSSPEGEVVLDDLRQMFFRRSGLVQMGADFSPNAAFACAAQRAMFLYIEDLVEGKANAGTDAITDANIDPTIADHIY